MVSIDAVVLAGGLGTRLQTAVGDQPKPLATVQGRPFLDILVDDLVRQGLRRIIFCVSHRREQIIAHFRDRTDAEFQFSEEETPLGTGGAVRHAAHLIRSDLFLVLNGDSFCRIDYQKFLAFHRAKSAALSIVVTEARGRTDGGTIELAANGRIASFREKTSVADTGRAFINAGIYLMRKDAPASWKRPYPFSLERDIFPDQVAGSDCYGFVVEAEVVDIGTPERYADAQYKF